MGTNSNQKGKVTKVPSLETLKDLGTSVANDMRQEASQMSEDFMQELLGLTPRHQNYSGEIVAGEAIEMNEVLSGHHEELVHQRRQAEFLLQLEREEQQRLEKKTNELRMQIKVLQEEMLVVVEKTQDLAEETKIAAAQSVVDPGEYHVIFFEKLLEFIKSFRKKIEQAGTWLQSLNKRTAKKNVWGSNYQKSGGKYLLSSEHYLQRSAG